MIDPKKVSEDAFDAMWSMLQFGQQKANYPVLKEYCLTLRQMMLQKTAGQRRGKPKDVSFDDLDTIKNAIVIEAMMLVLSGEFETKVTKGF